MVALPTTFHYIDFGIANICDFIITLYCMVLKY